MIVLDPAHLVDALAALCRADGGEDGPALEHAVGLMVGLLDEASSATRLAVAQVLGRIGRKEDAEVVSSLMKDSDPEVRGAAVEALSGAPAVIAGDLLVITAPGKSARIYLANEGN